MSKYLFSRRGRECQTDYFMEGGRYYAAHTKIKGNMAKSVRIREITNLLNGDVSVAVINRHLASYRTPEMC